MNAAAHLFAALAALMAQAPAAPQDPLPAVEAPQDPGLDDLTAERRAERQARLKVTRWEPQFQGNAGIGASELLNVAIDEIADLSKYGWRRAEIDDAAFAMESHYHGRGWNSARVRWEAEIRGEVLQARFLVEEGPRTVVERVRIRGAESIPLEQLRALVLPADPDLLEGPYYVAARAKSAPGSIRAAYLARGYLDVVVSEAEIVMADDQRSVRIRIDVQEGVAYVVRAVPIEGAPELVQPALAAAAAGFLGKPFFPRREVELQARVEEELANQGWAVAKASVERAMDAATGAVTLTVKVVPGPRIRIAAVRVQGIDRTRASFVRSRVRLQTGDWYNRRVERTSFLDLFKTGLFTRIAFRLEGDGEERTLVVEVEEAPARSLEFEPGYGSYERFRAELSYRDRNIFGTGRAIRTELDASLVGASALAGFTDPWFLGSRVELDVPVFYRRRKEPSFTLQELGAGADLKRALTRNFSLSGGYQLRRSSVSGVEFKSAARAPVENLRIASVALEPRYDSRNDYFNPSTGALGSLRMEYAARALGGELEYTRLRLSLARYMQLDEAGELVLATAFRSGWIAPVGETNAIPLQERFFNGGEDTVRSFRESRLGPLTRNGRPLGGEVFNVLNVEMRRKMTGNLWGAVFADWGNAALEPADWFSDWRLGLGAGARYLLPVGALRLDFGWNPATRTGEQALQVIVSVGMAF
ncbi:MAG TPA: BamA/TamA family outer membrane protein [Planctomycetota bacterium]